MPKPQPKEDSDLVRAVRDLESLRAVEKELNAKANEKVAEIHVAEENERQVRQRCHGTLKSIEQELRVVAAKKLNLEELIRQNVGESYGAGLGALANVQSPRR